MTKEYTVEENTHKGANNKYSVHSSKLGYVCDVRDSCPDKKQMAGIICALLNENNKYRTEYEVKRDKLPTTKFEKL